MSRFMWANWDKPHRCPNCHCVDWREAEESRRWHWWSIGRCWKCATRWSWGQARLRLWVWRRFRR